MFALNLYLRRVLRIAELQTVFQLPLSFNLSCLELLINNSYLLLLPLFQVRRERLSNARA